MKLLTHIQIVIVTSLYLQSLLYIPLKSFWFSQILVLFFFCIHYRTEDVVCQNILKVNALHTSVNPT
jgi:hypothetical protein